MKAVKSKGAGVDQEHAFYCAHAHPTGKTTLKEWFLATCAGETEQRP